MMNFNEQLRVMYLQIYIYTSFKIYNRVFLVHCIGIGKLDTGTAIFCCSISLEWPYKSCNPSMNLPIFPYQNEIVASVTNNPTTILVAETGSGKSTQVPQYLLNLASTRCRIACTQPRRIAAVSVAQRVAFEQGCILGETVGYSIRFEDKSSKSTKIKFLTDGVLLRECISDPDLSQYGIIILDEAHERSLQTDILIGLIRQIQDRRSDLRVIVMSATLEVGLFVNFFKV